jgi:hypothetical protein
VATGRVALIDGVALTASVGLAGAVPVGATGGVVAVGVTGGVVAVGSGVMRAVAVAAGLAVTVGGAFVAVGGNPVGVAGAAATAALVGAGAGSGAVRAPVHADRGNRRITERKSELRVIGLNNSAPQE